MNDFKLLKGYINPNHIPDDHYIVNVSPEMYEPRYFNRVKIIYHKHQNPNISRVYKMYIAEGHPLWHTSMSVIFI